MGGLRPGHGVCPVNANKAMKRPAHRSNSGHKQNQRRAFQAALVWLDAVATIEKPGMKQEHNSAWPRWL